MDNYDGLYNWWITKYGPHIEFELNTDLNRKNKRYEGLLLIEIALFMLDQPHMTILGNGMIEESGILTALMGIDFFRLLKNLTKFIEDHFESEDYILLTKRSAN